MEHLGHVPAANLWRLLQCVCDVASSPTQLAWEALLSQAHTNHKMQEQAANLVQLQVEVQREMFQAQREVIQVQREARKMQRVLAQANRVTAEAMLVAMREAQGSYDGPCQADELRF